ncbi:hypothetical protein C0992_001415 [Termitomyces sp. T32_za158]|nr:hypothetical protein C0992_001415 [Termitomyces sp. T32_za158]
MLELERANKSLSDSLRLEAPSVFSNSADLLPYSATAPHLSAYSAAAPQSTTYNMSMAEAGKHSHFAS